MTQLRIEQINMNELKVFIKQNNFFAGTINLQHRTFYCVNRSAKNLFNLFGKPGLGINEEILLNDKFDFIVVKYQDQLLKTTRLKWLNSGIVSRYCNQKVDKQIILMLENINMQNTRPIEDQGKLFK